MYIDDSKFVIIAEPKTICFNLTKKVDNSRKHEINSIIKHNEFLTEHKLDNKISQLVSKYKHGNVIHEHRKQ